MRRSLFVFVAALLTIGSTALGQDIHLYETVDNTPNGTPSEKGPLVPSPGGNAFAGFAVLRENPNGGNGLANWSDVVEFTHTLGGANDSLQLTSDGAFDAAFVQRVLAGDPGFGNEDPSGVTDLSPG